VLFLNYDIPRSPAGDILPQKGSSDGIYDGVYATSSMDLRPGYFNKYPRVPLHPIQYSLLMTTILSLSSLCVADGHLIIADERGKEG
jgi:hypothetical protein